MICERCGSKGRNIRTHELKVTYESGNGFIYNLCSDCVRDIERFIKTEPNFNAFGYNLDFEKNYKEVYEKRVRSGMTREEAIKVLLSDSATYKELEEAVSIAVEALKEQRKHGEWLKKGIDFGTCWATCSVCNKVSRGKAHDNGFGND